MASTRPRLFPEFRPAATQITKRAENEVAWDIIDEFGGAESDIETEFRGKLAGLRRLPARERIHALRAAKDARRYALNALKERRHTARRAKRLSCLKEKPAPR